MKLLYGYAHRLPDVQCAIRPETPTVTVCGRHVGFLPAHDDDYVPTRLHDECQAKIDELGGQA